MAKSSEGDYREEHLFVLRQPLVGYRFYKSFIAEVDVELESKTRQLPPTVGGIEPRNWAGYHRVVGLTPCLGPAGPLL